jgi:hypothetical protein
MYQETKVCRAKELCRCPLWPWLCDLDTEIPFCSVSPKRMKIFGWYLVWGCIRGQRCVRQKICVYVTFDLDPVTMTPNCIIFPFRSIIPKRLKIFAHLDQLPPNYDEPISTKLGTCMCSQGDTECATEGSMRSVKIRSKVKGNSQRVKVFTWTNCHQTNEPIFTKLGMCSQVDTE